MTDKKDKRKLEPKFGLDMDFGEALERFAKTDPKEVAESIDRSKQKKPPGDQSPGGNVHRSRKDRPRQPRRNKSGG